MYLDFFRLSKAPFHITPDPSFLFLSPSHKEALGSIIYGIEKRKGFLSIVGEVGVGKTTILRSYLEGCDRSSQKTIYLFNSSTSFPDLLKTLCRELGVDLSSTNVSEMVNALHLELIDLYRQGQNVVLIIDEAQNYSLQTLESLRKLSNLETNKDKLIQIVLVGQPELQDKLNDYSLRQLRQRIAIRSVISPLNRQESIAYIKYRLAKAATSRELIFTPKAMSLISKEAAGIPRIINILCDNALIAGLGYRKKPIDARIVREVIRDFAFACGEKRRIFPLGWVATVFGICLLVAASFLYSRSYLVSPKMPNASVSSVVRDAIPSIDEGRMNTTHPDLGKPLQTRPSATTRPTARATTSEGVSSADPKFPYHQDQTVPGTGTEIGVSLLDRTFNTMPSFRTNKNDSVQGNPPGNIGVVPGRFRQFWVVRKGDNLSSILMDTYGFYDARLVAWIKEQNPHLRSPHILQVGDTLVLPAIDENLGKTVLR